MCHWTLKLQILKLGYLLLCWDFLGLGFCSILVHYTATLHFTLFEMKDLSSTPHS